MSQPPKSTNPKTVYLGMSGGVDSSLSAVLLKEQGYHVVGVYMKNWSKDLPGMKCPWADDLADAKRVAVKLDLDFKVFDFETEYKQKVVDYMLAEFKAGRTPNPDIMCNQEIKFKLFYDIAREQGADLIATGHYARIGSWRGGTYLRKAVDENKDQTYFLYRISQDAIDHTLFPIGHLKKPEVKKLAAEYGLDNAYKKESMGVCFVGDVGMDDFLREYFEVNPGPIIEEETGKELGVHEGAIFYTLGQRRGLNLGGGLPYYVVRKDIEKNIVYVSRNLNAHDLWTTELNLEDIILRETGDAAGGAPPPRGASSEHGGGTCGGRTRFSRGAPTSSRSAHPSEINRQQINFRGADQASCLWPIRRLLPRRQLYWRRNYRLVNQQNRHRAGFRVGKRAAF